ncbi:MAG: TIGR04076 family protein [Eisenbergiella sp.]
MEHLRAVSSLRGRRIAEAKSAFCSKPDAISRYIYTALQGGSIMHGWTKDDRVMIACCNDGTRPVIFKIERIDCE